MKAAVFYGEGKVSVEERKKPEIQAADDVLVQVKAASICGSDLHVLNVPPGQYAKPDTILGHEFCGEVIQTGEKVKLFQKGDRVIIEPIIKCGMCEACRNGLENLCEDSEIIGQTRDGGFAEYCVIPQRYLYRTPDEVSDRLAALAEPLACVMHGILKLNPMAHEKAVIFGAGAIGLIFLKVLKYYGVRNIIVCEPEPGRRQDALRLGANLVIDTANENVEDKMKQSWSCMADIAVDAVGIGSVMEQAVSILRPGGRLLIFGQNTTQWSRIKPSDINTKELMILGTMSTRDSFPVAVELLRNPELHLEEIISHELSLEEFEKGIQLMRMRQGTKIIILPQERTHGKI